MKINVTFTEDELKEFIARKEAGEDTCQGIDCYGIDCQECPLSLFGDNDEAALEYIKNHLE